MNQDNIDIAKAKLTKLVTVCFNKTGQSYKIRSLLYSLWNGKPTSVLNIITLDHELRGALLIVMAAFGDNRFFYDEVKAAFVERGLFDWFCEEGESK